MYWHGLIALAISYLLLLPNSYPKDIREKNLKSFKEGLERLHKGDHEGAYSKFRRSRSKEFILLDYSHLFMAKALKEGSKPQKALSLIKKHMTDIQPSAYLNGLLGEIYADLGRYDEACDSFSGYFAQSRDYKDTATFSKFSGAFAMSSKPPEFFMAHLTSYLKRKPRPLKKGRFDYIEDIMTAYSGKNDPVELYKTVGMPVKSMDIMRSIILWGDHQPDDLLHMSRLAQRLKDYRLKLTLLKQLLKLQNDRLERGNIEFKIAMAYLNMDEESKSLIYFKRAGINAKGYAVSAQADYYCGRIWEFWKDMTKAAFYYRKAKNIRFSNSEEKDFVIKSLSRAGWVNYKSGRYVSALKDYRYLVSRFGLKPSQDGYSYWYGMTLKKLGELEKAKTVFESLFTDYPLSYYSILGALRLKDIFGAEPPTPRSDPQYAGPVTPEKMRILSRSFMLIDLGLNALAKDEMAGMEIDYNNASEIVLASTVYNFLENHRKSLALVDFLINQKRGMPGIDLLNLYYPLRYFNFISHLSGQKGLDPFIIFSLLRQESAFDATAVSPAGAKGLMQIMPSLGLKTARDMKLGQISEEDLHFPKYNLKIGISHFAKLYEKFGKSVALAACAYNSSESKVLGWKKKYRSANTEEFIEDIPYFETRIYAKMIVRNYANYLRVYSRDWREALKGGL